MAREVDLLLAQLDRKHKPPESPKTPPAVTEVQPATSTATIVWATTPEQPASPAPLTKIESPINERVTLWGRVLLGTSLGLMMVKWPYAHNCGWALLGYGTAVATVLITGAWIGLVSWRQRSGPAHLLALLLFYWGLVLAAEQVLPRVGFGGTDATWTCSVSPSPGP